MRLYDGFMGLGVLFNCLDGAFFYQIQRTFVVAMKLRIKLDFRDLIGEYTLYKTTTNLVTTTSKAYKKQERNINRKREYITHVR